MQGKSQILASGAIVKRMEGGRWAAIKLCCAELTRSRHSSSFTLLTAVYLLGGVKLLSEDLIVSPLCVARLMPHMC